MSEQTITKTQPVKRRRRRSLDKELTDRLSNLLAKTPAEVAQTVKEIAVNLSTNPQGVGFLSVLTGIGLKTAGVKAEIDLLPVNSFTLFGLKFDIPEEAGKIPIADTLAFMGLIAIGAEGIRGIGGIVPG